MYIPKDVVFHSHHTDELSKRLSLPPLAHTERNDDIISLVLILNFPSFCSPQSFPSSQSLLQMATLASLIPNAVQSLHFKPTKVGGVYHKALSGRKRSLLVRSLHEATPKKWETRVPKGVKHDALKIARYVSLAFSCPWNVNRCC